MTDRPTLTISCCCFLCRSASAEQSRYPDKLICMKDRVHHSGDYYCDRFEVASLEDQVA